jgi:hypothetical protein
MTARAVLAAAFALPLLACTDASGPRREVPVTDIIAIAGNPGNVISALVSFTARHADSVAVAYRGEGEPGECLTPATADADSGELLVLGLSPDRRYQMRVIAYGDGTAASSASLSFTTGALPLDLPAYAASGTAPSEGYVVFAAGNYGVVIDNTGRVVWYHHFPDGAWLNFMAQPNDRYVARRVTADPSDIERWVEVDRAGRVTRTLPCAGGLQPRFHDMIAERDGGYWVLCDETRTMDLTVHGGSATARVTGTVVQHIAPAGGLTFQWSAFDHFALSDVDPTVLRAANVNWTHGNAIDIAEDGNLLVSFRNLNEVAKIDSRTGAVLWRLGGARNQFARHAGAPAFAGQHSVRAVGTDRLLLLDNIGDASVSRAEEWGIDPVTRVATLLRSRTAEPSVMTLIGGSVQPLAGNRMLVSFGTEGRVEEYDDAGQVVWRIEGTAGYIFRAQRIGSLYAPSSR